MKFNRLSVLFLAFVLLLSNQAFSQINTFEFMRLDLNPRAAAVAGSYVANYDDPNVIFYNPAGLNSLENIPVSFSYVSHLAGISLGGLSVSGNFENIGHFGLGVNYINYGTMTRADAAGTQLGEFNSGEVAFVLGYANKLDENFYYGAGVKYIYSGMDNVSSTGLGFDLGLQYMFPQQGICIGFSALNMGTQIKKYFDTKEDLPLDVKLGFSKKMEKLPFTFYFSFNRLNDDRNKFFSRLNSFSFGGEFNLSKVLRLRLGYDNDRRRDFKLAETTGIAGFNIGVGAFIKGYNFDYSFSSFGLVGSISRIGITTAF
ncbi:MAG: type IX secretion system protein PorQ [Syntrophothermus sp.]